MIPKIKNFTLLALALILAALSIACAASSRIQKPDVPAAAQPDPSSSPTAAPTRAPIETAAAFPPTGSAGETVKDIPYRQLDGFSSHDTSLDIYPVTSGANLPVMIYVHGGGWQRGDKSNVTLKPQAFNQAGYIFVSLNYRLLPEVEIADQAGDLAAAIAWLQANINAYGGDPYTLFLMGHSAGAHLVSLVATDSRYLESEGLSLDDLQGVVSLDTQAYDVTVLMEQKFTLGERIYDSAFGSDPQTWKLLSPASYIAPDKGIPPFLVAYSRLDSRARLSAAFTDALDAAGVRAELLPASEKTHAEINRQIGEPGDEVTQGILNFLSSLLPSD